MDGPVPDRTSISGSVPRGMRPLPTATHDESRKGAPMHERSWIDPRDGREWTITHNPGVELAPPRERADRSRLIFESADGERLHTDAVYGTDLETLADDDLQGLLDQAREEEDRGGGPWNEAERTPGS